VATVEEIRRRLREDTPYYAEHCVKIVDKRSRLVSLVANGAQLKLDAALEAQRAAGLPMRAIVLKSRKVGISTWTQAKLVQRTTLRPNRRGLVVAQDNDTAGELHDIGWTAYVNLPDEGDLKPGLVSRRSSKGGDKFLHFGNRAANARLTGDMGLNSSLAIDTADTVDAGRGKTITDLHCSEVAFWKDPRKALALLNAVPDEPETLIVLESTANSHNFFKARWDRAMRGEGGFAPVFIGWQEDPDCVRPFHSDEAREAFIATIGTGPWGKDEPRLVEKFGCTPEQLHWRRYAIVDKCEGKLELFKQEYPSSPEEAFIGSGRHVFSIEFIQRALDRTEVIDKLEPSRVALAGPQQGLLLPAGVKTRRLAYGEAEVPTGAMWTPREATGFGEAHPFWTVWQHPWLGVDDAQERFARGLLTDDEMRQALERREQPPGQYLVNVDPAGDDENTSGEGAFHAIEVIDHRTGDQVAEYAARGDSDEIAMQAMLAGLWYGEAWIAVEATGGWGHPLTKLLWKAWGYRRVYARPGNPDAKNEQTQDRLGWSTDRRTKPLLEETMRELLREGTHGIRSRMLALELTTYVKLSNGQHGPDGEAFSDRLMAFMIGQYLRTAIPLRPNYKPGESFSSLTRELPR
jgi:hypothetical protein